MPGITHKTTAAIEPQVPGPGFNNPTPNHVPAIHAHRVRLGCLLIIAVLLRTALLFAQAFEYIGVENRR